MFLVAIAAVVYGSQRVYVVLTNRHPVEMSVRDFATKKPSAKWLRLTDCDVDYLGAVGVQSRVLKVDKGTFVPVRPKGDTGPAPLLLKMDSEQAEKRFAERFLGATRPARAAEHDAGTGETVEGMLAYGFDDDESVRKALAQEVSTGVVASGFAIMRAGERPDMSEAVGGIAVILGLAVVGVLILRNRRRTSAAPVPPPLPPAPQ